jgi:hypothetical protein
LLCLGRFSLSSSCTELVAFVGGRSDRRQVSNVHTEQHKYRIKAHKTDIHELSGIRNHDPSVPASEDSSCLRLRSHCDRLTHRTFRLYNFIHQFAYLVLQSLNRLPFHFLFFYLSDLDQKPLTFSCDTILRFSQLPPQFIDFLLQLHIGIPSPFIIPELSNYYYFCHGEYSLNSYRKNCIITTS